MELSNTLYLIQQIFLVITTSLSVLVIILDKEEYTKKRKLSKKAKVLLFSCFICLMFNFTLFYLQKSYQDDDSKEKLLKANAEQFYRDSINTSNLQNFDHLIENTTRLGKAQSILLETQKGLLDSSFSMLKLQGSLLYKSDSSLKLIKKNMFSLENISFRFVLRYSFIDSEEDGIYLKTYYKDLCLNREVKIGLSTRVEYLTYSNFTTIDFILGDKLPSFELSHPLTPVYLGKKLNAFSIIGDKEIKYLDSLICEVFEISINVYDTEHGLNLNFDFQKNELLSFDFNTEAKKFRF
ncbi:MAG: hypothetical protein IPP71_10115 [Bacteroidetes bacterium]|nr:hypothetical protein [Bacteroidota bacterium]